MKEIYQTSHTIVNVLDTRDPNAGGACHEYAITHKNGRELCRISFQHGPVGVGNVNGIQHVDLLAILRHRLDCFQDGVFSSTVNEVTCGFIADGMGSEETRTRRRKLAGVEGTNAPAPGVEGSS